MPTKELKQHADLKGVTVVHVKWVLGGFRKDIPGLRHMASTDIAVPRELCVQQVISSTAPDPGLERGPLKSILNT